MVVITTLQNTKGDGVPKFGLKFPHFTERKFWDPGISVMSRVGISEGGGEVWDVGYVKIFSGISGST